MRKVLIWGAAVLVAPFLLALSLVWVLGSVGDWDEPHPPMAHGCGCHPPADAEVWTPYGISTRVWREQVQGVMADYRGEEIPIGAYVCTIALPDTYEHWRIPDDDKMNPQACHRGSDAAVQQWRASHPGYPRN